MHTPVLLEEVIEGLDVKKDGLYIDATVGEGGHLVKIAEKGGKVLALDWDGAQISNIKCQMSNLENVTFAVSNFSQIEKKAKELNFYPVDGILFDLGLSMKQIAEGGRGFSYRNQNEPLDMRISLSTKVNASDLVNSLSEQELYEIFASYGEEIYSQAIAQAVISFRIRRKIKTVGDMIKAIDYGVKDKGLNDQFQKNKVYTRIFQALRIAVNKEFENLKKGLKQAMEILKPGGRIAVITFHSREDRIVKQFARENGWESTQKKVIAGDRRISFERSAKLRILIRQPAEN
ncbi:MAG: 16S rRNA (cytosine(1402)-N(4))-methyltransferase RsmH [Candidatus Roizmanbacteria bacterium]|nr:MAG: 16S rRNA (cytosine(1402)-N(4))-methyltransferase RsmH [Candidatus Roizmanbacteria bacterium]